MNPYADIQRLRELVKRLRDDQFMTVSVESMRYLLILEADVQWSKGHNPNAK